MTTCIVKDVSHSDEPTENQHPPVMLQLPWALQSVTSLLWFYILWRNCLGWVTALHPSHFQKRSKISARYFLLLLIGTILSKDSAIFLHLLHFFVLQNHEEARSKIRFHPLDYSVQMKLWSLSVFSIQQATNSQSSIIYSCSLYNV